MIQHERPVITVTGIRNPRPEDWYQVLRLRILETIDISDDEPVVLFLECAPGSTPNFVLVEVCGLEKPHSNPPEVLPEHLEGIEKSIGNQVAQAVGEVIQTHLLKYNPDVEVQVRVAKPHVLESGYWDSTGSQRSLTGQISFTEHHLDHS